MVRAPELPRARDGTRERGGGGGAGESEEREKTDLI